VGKSHAARETQSFDYEIDLVWINFSLHSVSRQLLHRDVVGSVSYSNHLSAAFITSISANMYSMLKFPYGLHAASNGLTVQNVMQRRKIIG
jgi:hypothetical protein